MRYFLNFRKCAYESLLQHRNILRKSEKHFCEILWIRCTFSLKIQFVIMFGLTLGPDYEIFSQFQEMRLWISSSASQCLAKKRKTFLWGFVDPMHLFIKDSICHNVWPNFGPRFWDIFSISGNVLVNHFFSIVISCEKGKNGAEVLQVRCNFSLKIQFFMFGLTFETRFWDIVSISGNVLDETIFLHRNILLKSGKQFWDYADQMQLFIKDSIFHNVWPNLGPRFWDIFTISGNAFMNHFFSIVISCKKA